MANIVRAAELKDDPYPVELFHRQQGGQTLVASIFELMDYDIGSLGVTGDNRYLVFAVEWEDSTSTIFLCAIDAGDETLRCTYHPCVGLTALQEPPTIYITSPRTTPLRSVVGGDIPTVTY